MKAVAYRICTIIVLLLAIWLFRLEAFTDKPFLSYDNEPISEFSLQRTHIESLYKTFSDNYELVHKVAFFTVAYATKNNLPPVLVAAIIVEESSFNPLARGRAGELGLMQVHPRFWTGAFPDCGQDLLDIKTNICYGSRILRRYIEAEEGSVFGGLKRYNGGRRNIYINKIRTRLAYMHLVEKCY